MHSNNLKIIYNQSDYNYSSKLELKKNSQFNFQYCLDDIFVTLFF